MRFVLVNYKTISVQIIGMIILLIVSNLAVREDSKGGQHEQYRTSNTYKCCANESMSKNVEE